MGFFFPLPARGAGGVPAGGGAGGGRPAPRPPGCLLLSNALTWYIGQKRQVEGLRSAYFERIYWISESLAAKTTEWVGTSNWAQLEINFTLLDSQPELVCLRSQHGERNSFCL